MLKRFLSVVLIVSLLSVPAFAVSSDVYEVPLDVDLTPSVLSLAVDNAVLPLAATSWDTSDQAHLAAIRNALTYASTIGDGSVLGWVKKLADNYQPSPFDSDSVLELTQIKSAAVVNLPYLEVINRNINTYISNLSMLGDILNKVGLVELDTTSISQDVDSIYTNSSSYFTWMRKNTPMNLVNSVTGVPYVYSNDLLNNLARITVHLSRNATEEANGTRTLYSRLMQLQEVLASDDDLALAKSQQTNRQEIEDSFLSGSSGDTSLGASDFGALSDIGGSFKDTVSLNGQSSISDLMDGLASADESGQGWFSTATKDALDTVSSTSSYSLRGDPYNMAGWEQRYAWLNGG